MPLTRETRMQACKTHYFGADAPEDDPFRNAGMATIGVTSTFFSPDDIEMLHRHTKTKKTDKGTNVEILRGGENSPIERANFGGACAMAEWLLRARNPQVHYGDFMNPDRYADEKREVGHEVAVALEVYMTTGDNALVTALTAECMKAYGQMDVRQELAYALGVASDDPNEPLSEEDLRDAMEDNPVQCAQFLESLAVHNQNSEQMFSGFDRGRTAFNMPPSASDTPTKIAIRQALTPEQLDAYCQKTQEIRQFKSVRRLRGARDNDDFVAIQATYERRLDALAKSDGTYKPLSPWERQLDDGLTNRDAAGTPQTYDDFAKGQSEMLLEAINLDHGDVIYLRAEQFLHSAETPQGFSNLAKIAMIQQQGLSMDDVLRLDVRDERLQAGAIQTNQELRSLKYLDPAEGAVMGDRLHQFQRAVESNALDVGKLDTMNGIASAFHMVKATEGLIETALTFAEDMRRGPGSRAAFDEAYSQDEQDALKALGESYQAISGLMERASDTTLSTDERLIAKRTLERLTYELDGEPVGPDTKELIGEIEAEQREDMAYSTDIVVEERALAYLEGDLRFHEITDENQLFRSLPKLDGKTELNQTLGKYAPETYAPYDLKALYHLGHKPQTMASDPAALEVGVQTFDEHFGHLAQDHQSRAYRDTGFESPTSTFFIDGMSVQEYAKAHNIPCDGEDMEKATIMSAIVSGEHHVELGTLGMDERGNFGVNVSTVNMDVSALDGQESFFSRKASGKAQRLHEGNTQQDQRRSDVKGRLQSEFATGMARVMNANERVKPEREQMSYDELPVEHNKVSAPAPRPAEKTNPTVTHTPVTPKK